MYNDCKKIYITKGNGSDSTVTTFRLLFNCNQKNHILFPVAFNFSFHVISDVLKEYYLIFSFLLPRTPLIFLVDTLCYLNHEQNLKPT